MAKRVRKTYKQRQRELEAPEVVEETLWSLSDWMEENWRPFAIGLGALTIIWGGIGVYDMMTVSSANASAESTAPVFAALNQPVYVKPDGLEGEDPNKPLGPSFASEKARADAVLAATAAGGESKAVELIGVLEGAAKAATGDAATQVAKLDAALASVGDSALALPLYEQKAAALTGLGKTAEAAAVWKKVADGAKTSFSKAYALIRIGDLNNARTGAGKTNADAAKGSYSKAISALKVGGKAPEKGPLAFLHAEATAKLASL